MSAPLVALAEIGEATVDEATGVATAELDGSRSFDPDQGGSIASYRWEVLTEAYQWVEINDRRSAVASFEVPPLALAARYGGSIEFRLTVTDSGRPSASDSATVTYAVNRAPSAAITVSAMAPTPQGRQLDGYDDNGNNVVDENEERYSVEGVIHGPGEGGNADNEWRIRERSLLVVDGSASSDPDGELPDSAFSWERIYHSDVPSITRNLPGDEMGKVVGKKTFSTDDDPGEVGTTDTETVGPLPNTRGAEADPYYLYYRLTVTDDSGASDSAVVKIVIHDAHADPTVEIAHPESDPRASSPQERREGIQPAGKNRYIVSPEAAEQGVTLTATAAGDGSERTRALGHTWYGTGVEPSESNRRGSRSVAVFTAPEDTLEGESFVVGVGVVDPAEHSASASVELVVAENAPPTATVPDDIDTLDSNNGGFPAADPPTGVVTLRGFGFDLDREPLWYKWEQVGNQSGDPLTAAYRGPRLLLRDSATDTASFKLPEVTRGDQDVVYVQFTVTDLWGATDSGIVTITIRDGDDTHKALAGKDQRLVPGQLVRLRGDFSAGLVSAADIAAVEYQWDYVGIETHPRTELRAPITEFEASQGYAPGQWFPDADGSYHPTAGGRVLVFGGRFPHFTAPELGEFDSVKLVFELSVRSRGDAGPDTVAATDTVAVIVVGPFFSGAVDNPDFCARLSAGGPATHPVDSDDDGVADACSLPTTRRAAIARQYALETLAALYPEALIDALHGPLGGPDESASPDAGDGVSGAAACAAAPADLPGDTEAALDADACGPEGAAQRRPSAAPGPVDPAEAGLFFSGTINGPDYCADYGLGGPRLHPHDSDGDGTADVCALPFTRREAVARQNALEAAFGGHPQLPAALAAACRALGTLDFGDHPGDLADDHCNPGRNQPRGQPLPTP